MLAVRLLFFTVLIPGTVAVVVPAWIAQSYSLALGAKAVQPLGVLFMVLGAVLYTASALAFLTEGKGTPAIWFARRFAFIIGKEPQRLVRSSLYRFSRNPMYLGVVTFVAGNALRLDSFTILIYAAALFGIFHLVIVLIEEPHLRRREGKDYDAFCRKVPRWIGIRRNDH